MNGRYALKYVIINSNAPDVSQSHPELDVARYHQPREQTVLVNPRQDRRFKVDIGRASRLCISRTLSPKLYTSSGLSPSLHRSSMTLIPTTRMHRARSCGRRSWYAC
jgi:hypothetical protein